MGTGETDAPSGRFTAVSAGGSHTCCLRADEAVECWGNNGVASYTSAGQCTLSRDGTVECSKTDLVSSEGIVGQASPPTGSFVSINAGTGKHLRGEERRAPLNAGGPTRTLRWRPQGRPTWAPASPHLRQGSSFR